MTAKKYTFSFKKNVYIFNFLKLISLCKICVYSSWILIDLSSCRSNFTSDLCCFDLSPPVPPAAHPVHRFASRTVTSGSLVLVTVATREEGAAQLTVNCEKMVIGTMLVKDILLALTQ